MLIEKAYQRFLEIKVDTEQYIALGQNEDLYNIKFDLAKENSCTLVSLIGLENLQLVRRFKGVPTFE